MKLQQFLELLALSANDSPVDRPLFSITTLRARQRFDHLVSSTAPAVDIYPADIREALAEYHVLKEEAQEPKVPEPYKI